MWALIAGESALALFQQREERESQRLAQIIDFATQPGCITRRLLGYFGESLAEENCGHCHYCRTGTPSEKIALPAAPLPRFTEEDEEMKRREFGCFANVPFHKVLAFMEQCSE